MGSSTGRFEGDTLVVETTNLTDELTVGRMPHSEKLKLTERFTRIDPDMIDYVVTVDDPRTYQAPWTFRLTLTTRASVAPTDKQTPHMDQVMVLAQELGIASAPSMHKCPRT